MKYNKQMSLYKIVWNCNNLIILVFTAFGT